MSAEAMAVLRTARELGSDGYMQHYEEGVLDCCAVMGITCFSMGCGKSYNGLKYTTDNTRAVFKSRMNDLLEGAIKDNRSIIMVTTNNLQVVANTLLEEYGFTASEPFVRPDNDNGERTTVQVWTYPTFGHTPR